MDDRKVIHHASAGCQESKDDPEAQKSWMWDEVTCDECKKRMSQ